MQSWSRVLKRAARVAAISSSAALISACGALLTQQAAKQQSKEDTRQDDSDFKSDPHMVIVTPAPVRLCANGLAQIPNTITGLKALECLAPEQAMQADPHRSAIVQAKDARTLIHEFGLMAVFATMAYHRHVPASSRYGTSGDERGATQDACTVNHKGHPLPALMEATHTPTGANGLGTWVRWLNGAAPACASEDGLFYETYVFEQRSAAGRTVITDAVIAFRGTENTQAQITSDWTDNFSAAAGVEPHQYKLARTKLKDTVELLHKLAHDNHYPMPRLYAVGHSLGGGLAQMAAYTQPDILAAYAFNTSAVTDWSYLKYHQLLKVSDPTIYRIQQRGEFLANLRKVTTPFNTMRLGRSDYEFNYQDTHGEVSKHSISLLACNFAAFIASEPNTIPAQPFGYDRVFSTQVFRLNLDRTSGWEDSGANKKEDQETLCKPEIRGKVCMASPAKEQAFCAH